MGWEGGPEGGYMHTHTTHAHTHTHTHTHIYIYIYAPMADSLRYTAETNNIVKQLHSDRN